VETQAYQGQALWVLAMLAALTAPNFQAGWNLATAREARLSLRLKKLEEYFSMNRFSNQKKRTKGSALSKNEYSHRAFG
jgi:hypothetical protein